jgi:hypothetical protein
MPVVREASQGGHVNVSYAEDGSIVELVVLDAQTVHRPKTLLKAPQLSRR